MFIYTEIFKHTIFFRLFHNNADAGNLSDHVVITI